MACGWRARPLVGYLRGWGFSPSGRSDGPWSRTLDPHPDGRELLGQPARDRGRGRAGWCCGWMRWGSAQMRRRGGPGRRSARPRLSREPASGFRVNMLSAVSNAGRLRFSCLSGHSAMDRLFIDFLGRLLRIAAGGRSTSSWMGIRCTGPSWSAPRLDTTPTASSCTFCPATAGAESGRAAEPQCQSQRRGPDKTYASGTRCIAFGS